MSRFDRANGERGLLRLQNDTAGVPHAGSAEAAESRARMKVAYLINQYPKVSHSFIRREIRALERKGVTVLRIALRGWDDTSPDPADVQERNQTRYVLRGGIVGVIGALIGAALSHPRRFGRALMLATKLGRRSDRTLLYHWIYLAEACVIARWMRESAIGHIHAHFGSNPAEVAMLASVLVAGTFSFTAHGTVETDNAEFIGLREKIERARFVAAVSFYGRGQLCRWVDVPHWAKIHVVRCGIEPDFWDVPPAGTPPSNRFVCVGRLSREKGQLVLLEAVRRVLDSGLKCELVLAGDGELRAIVDAEIERLQLSSCVRITGWISEERVRAEMLAARALVVPSFAEGLPVVIMEAMALRKPVVATFVAGIPELVNVESGWLVPTSDAASLAAAMMECLRAPADELIRKGEAGRERALAQHDVHVSAAKLVDIYERTSL